MLWGPRAARRRISCHGFRRKRTSGEPPFMQFPERPFDGEASGDGAPSYEWLDEWLCEYVDGTMDPSVEAVFEQYVEANPELQAHIERLRQTRDAGARTPGRRPRPRWKPRERWKKTFSETPLQNCLRRRRPVGPSWPSGLRRPLRWPSSWDFLPGRCSWSRLRSRPDRPLRLSDRPRRRRGETKHRRAGAQPTEADRRAPHRFRRPTGFSHFRQRPRHRAPTRAVPHRRL